MINRIFQFADIPLTLAHQAIFYSQSNTWSGSVGDYLGSTRKFANNHRFMHQPTELKFTGELVFDGTRLPGHLEQKLRSYVGFPDTIICYVLPNDYPPQFDVCEPCNTCCDCEIMWVSAPAVLTNISVDKSNFDEGFKIDLTFTLLDFFITLNPLVWAYVGSIERNYLIRNSFINSGSSFPNCETIFTDCIGCRFFTRGTFEGTLLISSIPNEFSSWSTFSADNFSLASRPNWTDSVKTRLQSEIQYIYNPIINPYGLNYNINIDVDKWGATPISYYEIDFYIDNTSDSYAPINTNSTLAISSSSALVPMKNVFFNGTVAKTETSYLDLKDLQTQMIAAGTTLRGRDRIWFGNVNYYNETNDEFYRPAMVYRATPSDGLVGIIPNVHPKFTYPSYAPLQLYPTLNKINIKYHPGWIAGEYIMSFNYIHWFRRI